ncbi:MAG: S-layer homology domain-containing protein [Clostridiales bacterium]|jgi:hypothetical protein|nr:S-layer homology domain-containing protein [Clostridiales bacterium]
MFKKLTSSLIILAMVLSLMPMFTLTVQAAGLPSELSISGDYTLYLDSTGLRRGFGGAAFTQGEGENWTWDATSQTLTLINFNFTSSAEILFEIAHTFSGAVNIALPTGSESSFASDYGYATDTYGIFSSLSPDCVLNFIGSGALSATAPDATGPNLKSTGFYAEVFASVNILGPQLTFTGGDVFGVAGYSVGIGLGINLDTGSITAQGGEATGSYAIGTSINTLRPNFEWEAGVTSADPEMLRGDELDFYTYDYERYLKVTHVPDYWQDEDNRADNFEGGEHVQTPADIDDIMDFLQSDGAEVETTLYIDNEEEFALFAYESADYPWDWAGFTVELCADLDLSAHLWMPGVLWNANFNGNGHTIEGLQVENTTYHAADEDDMPISNSDDYLGGGLFLSITGGTVQDFTLISPKVTVDAKPYYVDEFTNIYVGSVAGGVYDGAKIKQVNVEEPVLTVDDRAMDSEYMNVSVVGGIVGYTSGNAILTDCEVYGDIDNGGGVGLISATADNVPCDSYNNNGGADYGAYVGGIVGWNYDSVVTSCYSSVELEGNLSDDGTAIMAVGGIAGFTSATQELSEFCLLNNFADYEYSDISINLAEVGGGGDYRSHKGGIAGLVVNDSVVNNLYIGNEFNNGGTAGEYDGGDFFGHALNLILDSDYHYKLDANLGFLTNADAIAGNAVERLNDDTPGTGGMWKGAALTAEHAGYDMAYAMTRYRTWTVDDSGEIVFGGRYVYQAPTLEDIDAPAAYNHGDPLNLTAPQVTFGAADPSGAETDVGWEISADDETWTVLDRNIASYPRHDGYTLRYFAENSAGRAVSNAVPLVVNGANESVVPVTRYTIAMDDSNGDGWDNDSKFDIYFDGVLSEHVGIGMPDNGTSGDGFTTVYYNFDVPDEVENITLKWSNIGSYFYEVAIGVYPYGAAVTFNPDDDDYGDESLYRLLIKYGTLSSPPSSEIIGEAFAHTDDIAINHNKLEDVRDITGMTAAEAAAAAEEVLGDGWDYVYLTGTSALTKAQVFAAFTSIGYTESQIVWDVDAPSTDDIGGRGGSRPRPSPSPSPSPIVKPSPAPGPGLDTPLFADVPLDAWFSAPIAYAVNNNLMIGTSNTYFEPDMSTTRAMIATILWRLEGEPVGAPDAEFSDVASDTWYTKSVAWGAANGIILGYGDGTFKPEQNITREEMATIIANYLRYKGIKDDDSLLPHTFDDDNDIALWARDNVLFLKNLSVMKGRLNNLFDPYNTATRAETAQTLFNMIENVIKTD